MTDVMNGRLVLADPSSGLTALSLEGGELNMFGKYTRIRTTQRDSFPVINDAPTELKVVEESNSLNRFINGAIGLVVGVALGAVAVALIAAAGAATGGAAVPFLLGAIPFMVASTAAICTTVQINENDKYTGYKRSPVEFSNILVNNVMTAYTAGAMIAAVLEVAPGVVSYVGMNAIESFGISFFTKKAVPVIVKTGIGTLVTAKGAFTIFDINENNTGNNLLMDKAFDGDKESYEVCEECVDWLCESVIASGGLMPVPPSSLLREGNDPQDTDGYGHNGRTGITPYAYAGDTDGTDGDKAGFGKSPISFNKDLGNGIGLDTNKKIDPSLNLFSGVGDTPWNGQPDIQLEVFDGDAEGIFIEYQNEGENKKEENSEDGYTKGIYIERGNISLDDPIIDQLLEILSETRDDIGKKFKRGNVGIAIADIKGPKGDLITNFKSFSQYGNREGYSPVFTGDKKIFETKYVNNKNQENGPDSFDRLVDSEAKIIEDITHQLGYNKIGVDETLEGSVFLLTERIPCLSCQYVLDQFQDMFPNVNVVVIYVYIENTD